jgi:hypothetical protein
MTKVRPASGWSKPSAIWILWAALQVTVDAYAAVDVDRLILRPRPEMDAAAVERFAAQTSRALGLTA